MLKRYGAIAVAAAAAALTVGSPALANDGDVLVRGSCTGTSTAKLKLSEENGRIEIEFGVDQNRAGVRWNVVLRRGSSVAARLTRTTRAPSGSFEARGLVANSAGADVIRARATRGGESCSARATFPG